MRQTALFFTLLTLTILLASCQVAKPPPTPTPIPVPSLPAWCGEVGAQAYKEPLPTVSLPTILLERGTVITVTTASDAIDGDVSSVRVLLANPGPDGLSLREALEAANSDPGVYTIQFAPQLKGMTIKAGSWNQFELPFLTGGSVIINGDIDGDGSSDITLKNATQGHDFTFGLWLSSGGNVIHALTIEDFKVGVLFQPLSAETTFSDNVVSNLVLKGEIGIEFLGWMGGGGITGQARNQWVDTQIVGNIIESKQRGIYVSTFPSSGNFIERLTIIHNTIRLPQKDSGHSVIKFDVGVIGSSNSRVTDVVIAYNSVESESDAEFGINLYAGDSSGNVIERVRIIGNEVRMPLGKQGYGGARQALSLSTGGEVPDSEENVIRDVSIVGNVLEGGGGFGILLENGQGGCTKNTIRDVSILGNIIRGAAGPTAPWHCGILIFGGFSDGSLTSPRPSTDNEVSNVVIRLNSIQVTHASVGTELFPAAGGIIVIGGQAAANNRVTDVVITENQVDSDVVGIGIIGGWGTGQSDSQFAAEGNMVSGVDVSCNLVARSPRWLGVKGINLIGGFGAASGNTVDKVCLQDNLVAGVSDDVSLLSDMGTGASGNTVELANAP